MKHLLVLLATLSTTACSTTQNMSNTGGNDPYKYKFESRTYLSETCLLSESRQTAKAESLGATIAAVAVPKILEFVIDKASEKLTEIKKEETSSSSEFYFREYSADSDALKTGDLIFPTTNPNFKCLLTVTGNFRVKAPAGEDVAVKGGVLPVKADANWDAIDFFSSTVRVEIDKRLSTNNILLKDGEDGLFGVQEVKVVYAEDKSAFRLENRYYEARKTLKNRRNVGQVFTYKITGPGTTPNAKVYATIPVNIGKVSPGTKFYGDKFKQKKSGMVSTIGMSQASMLQFMKEQFGRPVCTNPVHTNCTKKYMPVELQVTNTQTKEPSKVAKFIGETLAGSKDSILEAVNKEFFPDESALAAAIDDADIAVKTALVAQSVAATDESKALAKAQLDKACKALKQAGGTHPKCDG